jgi:hypothetical protein
MLETVLFVVALVVLVLALFWILLKKSAAIIREHYQQLAERLGLELTIPPAKLGGFMRPEPSIYGSYRSRELSISVPGKGLQNTRQVETVLKIGMLNKTLRAQMTAAGALSRLSQRDSGGQARWKSGDEAFDRAVDLRTDQAAIWQSLLDPERRTWLADTLKRSKATLYVGGGTLAYARLGLIGSEAIRREFEGVIEFLCDLAETVEAESSLKK